MMLRMTLYTLRFACMSLLLALAGCGPAMVAVSSASTPTPPLSTFTPLPPTPSATPLPPTETPGITPSPTVTPTATLVPSPTSIALVDRQELFDQVWRTVNDHYLYPDFGGVDWNATREEFAPKIEAATSNEQVYALLTEMVDRLGDEHSRFLAPSAAKEEDALSTGREEQVGIGVITVAAGDGAWIQHIFPDSPAQEAGLRRRDRIIAVDGVFFNAGGDIQGPEGSQVRLTLIRPGEEPRDVVLTRRKVEGRITPLVRRLEGDVGYLGVTTLWVSDMAEQVSAELTAMTAEKPLRGMIIDLRGNPGGWQPVLTGILSHFVRGEVGTFYSQRADKPLLIDAGAGPDLRGLPLVVLIDRGTASYAEVIAAVLQREAGARVIGIRSSGNTETIYAYEFMGGARLWVAQEGFRLRSGDNLEGAGVQPDIDQTEDWTRFSEEADPAILAALQILTSSTK